MSHIISGFIDDIKYLLWLQIIIEVRRLLMCKPCHYYSYFGSYSWRYGFTLILLNTSLWLDPKHIIHTHYTGIQGAFGNSTFPYNLIVALQLPYLLLNYMCCYCILNRYQSIIKDTSIFPAVHNQYMYM